MKLPDGDRRSIPMAEGRAASCCWVPVPSAAQLPVRLRFGRCDPLRQVSRQLSPPVGARSETNPTEREREKERKKEGMKLSHL